MSAEGTRIRFWLVWNEHGRAPTYKHTSRQSADDEASRLATLNPNDAFVVLKAVGGRFCEPPMPMPIKIIRGEDDDGIPF